jgi:hypothetical protein
MVGAGAWTGELVWTKGRVGGDEPPGDCAGNGTVKLGLGEGRFTTTLLRFDMPFGLGLRLLICDIGEVKPLRGPSRNGGRWSKGTGATTATESSPSLSSGSIASISAALSSTDGTA